MSDVLNKVDKDKFVRELDETGEVGEDGAVADGTTKIQSADGSGSAVTDPLESAAGPSSVPNVSIDEKDVVADGTKEMKNAGASGSSEKDIDESVAGLPEQSNSDSAPGPSEQRSFGDDSNDIVGESENISSSTCEELMALDYSEDNGEFDGFESIPVLSIDEVGEEEPIPYQGRKKMFEMRIIIQCLINGQNRFKVKLTVHEDTSSQFGYGVRDFLVLIQHVTSLNRGVPALPKAAIMDVLTRFLFKTSSRTGELSFPVGIVIVNGKECFNYEKVYGKYSFKNRLLLLKLKENVEGKKGVKIEQSFIEEWLKTTDGQKLLSAWFEVYKKEMEGKESDVYVYQQENETNKYREDNEKETEVKESEIEENKQETEVKEPEIEENKQETEERLPEIEDNKQETEVREPEIEDNKQELEERLPEVEQKPEVKDEGITEERLETTDGQKHLTSWFDYYKKKLERNESGIEVYQQETQINESHIEGYGQETEEKKPEIEDNEPEIEDNEPEIEDNEPEIEDNEPEIEDDEPEEKEDSDTEDWVMTAEGQKILESCFEDNRKEMARKKSDVEVCQQVTDKNKSGTEDNKQEIEEKEPEIEDKQKPEVKDDGITEEWLMTAEGQKFLETWPDYNQKGIARKESAKQEPEEKQPEIEDVQQEPEEKQPEIEDVQQKSEEKQPEIEDVQQKSEEKQPEIEDVQQEPEEKQPEIDDVQQKSEEKQPEIEDVQQEPEEKQPEIDDVQQKSEEKQPEIEDVQQEPEEKQPEIGDVQQKSEEKQPEIEDVQQKSEEKQPEIEDVQQEPEEKQPEIEDVQQKSEEKQPEIEDVQEPEEKQPEIEDVQQKSEEKQPEIEDVQQKSEEKEPEIENVHFFPGLIRIEIAAYFPNGQNPRMELCSQAIVSCESPKPRSQAEADREFAEYIFKLQNGYTERLVFDEIFDCLLN